MISAKINQPAKTMPVDILDALDEVGKIRGEPTEKLEAILLGDDSEKWSNLM